MKELPKTYDPSSFEDRLYHSWEENGYFKAKVDPDKKPYTIVIPPPNITGQLHMGHALDETLQDILIRFKRMQGYSALWLPGTDHASIATEAKIVEQMRQEGISKADLGRDGFLDRAWDWKKKFGGRIVEQLKKLGSSCDWSRERFTLDEGCSKAVKEVFINFYEKGLIYRGERIINWCPHCRTSISDAEVDFSEKDGFFWHLRYPFKDGSGFLELATTRPETMLGDTAVAVHPDDERYSDMVGKTLVLPLVGREIPVIADEYVEIEFGTGVVKITPAHDPNDYEVGLRHHLEVINVMDEGGNINENGGKYAGMTGLDARKQIVKDLEDGGFLVKTEPIKHNVGCCYRCSSTVEPRVSKQWFVKMEPLAKPAIDVVKNQEIKFIPERMDKTYYNWMDNIKDWCISRQLWWGHRIPAWYCDDCGEMIVSRDEVTVCPKCGSTHVRQDEDTLDTWFSSALWPFSTLGWPDKTEELSYFYPTDTLVTGYDIIFFWVARMIFSGLAHMDEIPFKTVFFHGLVRDSQGRKMSKSLGNGIDPLEVIKVYGADALRFTLVMGNSPGNDLRFSDEKVEANRNFANKIWNAARFVQMNLDIDEVGLPDEMTMEDKWIVSSFNTLVHDVTENLDKFELGIAAAKLYDFIWEKFCDWYIELVKPRLFDHENPTRKAAQKVLIYVLTETLKLLHPFMPFITEEIWQTMPHEGESIMVSPWPTYHENNSYAKEEKQMELIMAAIRGIRNIRTQMNVPFSKKAKLILVTDETNTFADGSAFFEKLAGASEVIITDTAEGIDKDAVNVISEKVSIFIPLGDLVDIEQEIARLNSEKDRLQSEIDRVAKKLSNKSFTDKAPAAVVKNEEEKGKKYEEMLKAVSESLKNLLH